MRSIVPLAENFPNFVTDSDMAESNYCRLPSSNIRHLNTQDTDEFWEGVSKIKDSVGNCIPISEFYFFLSLEYCHCRIQLRWLNAFFSKLALIKLKSRNR